MFSVTSADDRDHHTVVWDKDSLRLVCTCPDYRYRCQTELDRGKKMKPYHMAERTLCKHTAAVDTFTSQNVVAEYFGVERTDIFEEHVA